MPPSYIFDYPWYEEYRIVVNTAHLIQPTVGLIVKRLFDKDV